MIKSLTHKIRQLSRTSTSLYPVLYRSTSRARLFVQTRKMFSLLVIFPWFLVAVYFVLIKTPTYESSTKIIIDKSEFKSSSDGHAGMLADVADKAAENYLIRDYILSREMLSKIEQSFPIKRHFQKADLISRLSKKNTKEEFLQYYHHMVKAVVDPETNQIIITATAYNPQVAEQLLKEIINQTKVFVNKVSNTLAEKQYNFAKLKLQVAKDKLFQASKDVIEWQNKNGMLDPKETAQMVSNVMGKLKNTLVEKQTELITYSSFMHENSNKIVTLKEEIKAIKAQIERQTKLLLGSREKNDKLNKIMSEFEWVQLQLKFAQVEYQAAQEVYDAAEISLARNQNMVIEIEPPNLPDEASSPRYLFDLTNTLLFLLVFFALTRMGLIIIKEHKD